MTHLVTLDVETTGLEVERHQVWEIAWAVEDGPVMSEVLMHSLQTADPNSLTVNGYFTRFPDGARSKGPLLDVQIRQSLSGATLLCANPHFDRSFLHKRWGVEPWHYRSIDIESYAMAIFGWERPRGLKDIRDELIGYGFDHIPEPDHTAARDVEVTRECYRSLQRTRKVMR